MPDSPETVTLTKNGSAIAVPVDKAVELINNGWSVETHAGRVAREEGQLKEERKPGMLGAAGLGALRGFSLGTSDIFANTLAPRYTHEALEVHPYASFGGAVAGSLAIPIPGAEEAGVGIGLARGAGEGALINTGNYISDVALGDKDLSAEGFVASAGKGTLWGAGGALGAHVSARGLSAARKLLPAFEATPEAVARAEGDAESAIRTAKDDSASLQSSAQQRLRELREELRVDPGHAAALDAIAQRAARDVEVQLAPARVVKMAMPKAEVGAAARGAVDSGAEAAGNAMGKEAVKAALPGEEAPTADDLLGQLARTKASLDEGASLGPLSGSPRATAIEDAVNDHAATVHPEAAKLVSAERAMRDADDQLGAWLGKHQGGEVAKFERKAAVDDWVAGRRAKTGWVTEVPEGEGTVGLPRGAQKTFRGSELDKTLSELDVTSKYERGRTLADKVLNPKKGDKVGQAFDYKGRPVTAQDVIDVSNAQRADRGLPAIDEQIKTAVRAKYGRKFADADVSDAIAALSRHEAAHADLTEALGIKAPPGTPERAAAYRAAEQAHGERVAEATARAAHGAAGKAAHGVMGAVEHLGEATELLHMLGVNVPDTRDIPLIGPLVSAFLRAKIGARVLRGVAPNATSAVASKAAAMRQRVQQAVAKSLEVAEKGARAAAPAMPRVSAILGHSLFRQSDEPRAGEAKTDAEAFRLRADELGRAAQPGAVEDAVSRATRADDPAVGDSIAATVRRKLDFLNSKMPRPSNPSGFDLEQAWTPDRQRMREFARYVDAAEDPVGALERTNGGIPPPELLETLREVYPKLYGEAQMHVMKQLSEHGGDIPFARRVQLGIAWRLPTDTSLVPGFGAAMQQGYAPPHPPQPAPMPNPTIRADVPLGKATANRTDGLNP